MDGQPHYVVREACLADLPALPRIEHAAVQRFAGTPHAPIAHEPPSSIEEFRSWLERGSLFVAVANEDGPVGFAIAFDLDGAAHLHEVDVDPGHGRRGVGRLLVEHVAAWAQRRGRERLTLTTFRDIAWNAPFYRGLGFEELAAGEAGPGLLALRERERANGLAVDQRLFMVRSCKPRPEVDLMPDDAQCEALGSFLIDRIYEFNSKATGYFDGLLLAGCIRDESGTIIAGFNGHTWGGCCELANVWVHEGHRGRGLGALLLRAAEAQARVRGCVQVVLASHSFQAPGFYERMGYERKYTIEGMPQGHADIVFMKALAAKPAG